MVLEPRLAQRLGLVEHQLGGFFLLVGRVLVSRPSRGNFDQTRAEIIQVPPYRCGGRQLGCHNFDRRVLMSHTKMAPCSVASSKIISGKGQGGAAKTGPSSRPANSFPGGNWPSKVSGNKSGGGRGQGPK